MRPRSPHPVPRKAYKNAVTEYARARICVVLQKFVRLCTRHRLAERTNEKVVARGKVRACFMNAGDVLGRRRAPIQMTISVFRLV